MTDQVPRRNRLAFGLIAAALVGVTIGIGWIVGQYRKNRAPAQQPETQSVASKRGALLYQTSCANCHGPEGAGDGSSAAALKPPPRDFAARPWRGEPTKASIRKVILAGIPGTAMPAVQGTMTESDLDALVDHVYTLATSRSPVIIEASPAESLLKAAGLIDLHGVDAPPLRVGDGAGRIVKLADLRGKRVILHFWGTTCAHCIQEMPRLRELEKKYVGRGLTILHVCADADDAKQAQAHLDQHAPGIHAWTDETGLGLARFEVQTLPTVWLIGPDGKAVARASGTTDWRANAMIQWLDHWLPREQK